MKAEKARPGEGGGMIWPVPEMGPQELLARAREIASRAYVPYSHFHVGAAMLFEGGEVLTACNVENASYGLSICAERAAAAAMVARGKGKPLAIAVAGSGDGRFDTPCPPCGACRQVLMEFNPEMLVVLASPEGPMIFGMREMLPHSFTLERER